MASLFASYLRITLWEQREEERKEGTAPLWRDRRSGGGWGQVYPCRCQSGRWGPLCGRRRGRGSPRRAAAPSSSRRADERTPGSRSSRPAPPSPRGRRPAALGGTWPGTRKGNGQPQRPGGGQDQKETLLIRDLESRVSQGSNRGFAQSVTRGTWRVRHSPVPGDGGAGKPGRGTAWADRGSAHPACSGFPGSLSRASSRSEIGSARPGQVGLAPASATAQVL